jgi:predicted phage terminase large subunit-like protein
MATTTPRPRPWLKTLLEQEGTIVTRGSTFDNRACLPAAYLAAIRAQYEGTRLGRQELYAEWLEDTPGALWTRSLLHACQSDHIPSPVQRVMIGVDPSVSGKGSAAMTGIVVAAKGGDGNFYVLADCSLAASPDGWARAVAGAFRTHDADRIIAEANNGGELVRKVLHTVDSNLPVRLVHASRGKITRAEPVAALYEQGRVKHLRSASLAALEDQMCQFSGEGASPDRLDALVWALTALMQDKGGGGWQIRAL